MSELKDYDIMDIEAMDDERLEKSESGKIQVTRVYIKSEADKVIAELKDDVAYWKKVARKNMDDNVVMARQRAEAFKRESHQKRKRCLAIALLCFINGKEKQSVYKLKTFFWSRWGNRWWKLAEKFKEAK